MIPLVRYADIFLQHNPGTDVMLLSAMCKIILDEGFTRPDFIAARTEGFEALADSLKDFDLDHAAASPASRWKTSRAAARLYAVSKPASHPLRHGHHPAQPRHR